MKITVNEKDRESTEKKLLDALGEVIVNEGFEKIGVNLIASKAGVSKVLIYRYFGSIDNMVIEYLSRNDFWENFSIDIPKYENLRDFMKKLFREQIIGLRNNPVIKRLFRWELIQQNTIVDKLRLKRESKGIALILILSQLTGNRQEDIASLATILNSSIIYLILLSDNCPVYNGVDIQSNKGWEQISKGMDLLIDLWFDKYDTNKQKE